MIIIKKTINKNYKKDRKKTGKETLDSEKKVDPDTGEIILIDENTGKINENISLKIDTIQGKEVIIKIEISKEENGINNKTEIIKRN